ncbi:MAG: hypothetical protein ACE5IP_05195 [Terriglobia bacterium]
MSTNNQTKLSRRQFAGTLAAALAAPALLGNLSAPAQAQEKKSGEKGGQAAQAQAEDFRARALKALREFDLPGETEPAFIFQPRLPDGQAH